MIRWVVEMYIEVASGYKFMRCGGSDREKGVTFIKKKRNKKLRYREEHSASVVLIGILNDIYRETINILVSTANQPLLRNWPRKAIEFRKITQNYDHYAVQGH